MSFLLLPVEAFFATAFPQRVDFAFWSLHEPSSLVLEHGRPRLTMSLTIDHRRADPGHHRPSGPVDLKPPMLWYIRPFHGLAQPLLPQASSPPLYRQHIGMSLVLA